MVHHAALVKFSGHVTTNINNILISFALIFKKNDGNDSMNVLECWRHTDFIFMIFKLITSWYNWAHCGQIYNYHFLICLYFIKNRSSLNHKSTTTLRKFSTKLEVGKVRINYQFLSYSWYRLTPSAFHPSIYMCVCLYATVTEPIFLNIFCKYKKI